MPYCSFDCISAGLTVKVCDINPDTGNIDINHLAYVISVRSVPVYSGLRTYITSIFVVTI